jgi:hypothetical protein
MTAVPSPAVAPVSAAPPQLTWRVDGVAPQQLAAVPTLGFRLAIDCPGGEPVRSIALSTSVRLAVALRDYDEPTRQRLAGVFGTAEQWANSLRELVWAQPTVIVPPFAGRTEVQVPVPCGYDIDLATVSYLHAVREGDVPLRFLFSGTMFYQADGGLRAAQVPWEAEASFRMPAETWHRLRERYFGASRWLRLSEASFDRLHSYRAGRAYPSWDATIDALLTEPSTGRNV